jgi:hypothetical protein
MGKQFTQAELAERYKRLQEQRKASYERNKEARKAYQRKRYAEMMAALRKERGR